MVNSCGRAFVKPKGFLSLRWWRTAGLIFSACCFLGFWVTFGIAVYVVLAWHANPPMAILLAVGLIVTIGVPAAIAIIVGTAIEAGMPQEQPLTAAGRTARLLQIVGSFLLGPFAILAWNEAVNLESRGEYAALEARSNRPIVSGDQVGFCRPPNYLVRDGLPVVELTIRLPRSGFYTLTAIGSDAARHSCEGQVDTVLQAGVHVLPITLRVLGGDPRVPEPIAWPVTVHDLMVRNVPNEQDPGGDGWYDSRYSTPGIATIGPPP
jgi:hypothetical protein